MDHIFLCPDCRSEHADPYDAVLGHRARCVACAMLLELLDGTSSADMRIVEIRVAA